MSATAFSYVAVDAAGRRRRGTLEAAGEREAYRQLANSGLTPVTIRGAQPRPERQAASFRAGRDRVTAEDISALTREIGVLVEARIPLAHGLVSIAEQEKRPALREVVRDLALMLESGRPLTEALTKHEKHFGEVYVNTVRAAEATGNLGEVMRMLAEMLERRAENARLLRRALAYPAFVLAFVLIALVVIVVFVIPRFSLMFEASGAELPAVTVALQQASESLRAWWFLYAGGAVGAVAGAIGWWRTDSGRRCIELAALRVPVVGQLLVAVAAARFSRVLSIALGSGLDLPEALRLAGAATGRPVFVSDTEAMSARVRGGAPLREVLRLTPYLPPFARRILGAGSDAREIAAASDVVARHFDRESEHLAKSAGALAEPIMTVAMAGIVLLVSLSVFLPMWQMVGNNR